MNPRAWVATRKGLFELQRRAAGWAVAGVHLFGEPVSMLLPPQSSGRMLAALNLGHFGVKLHASDDAGAHWHEVATPAYPAQPDDAAGPAGKLMQIWSRGRSFETLRTGLPQSQDYDLMYRHGLAVGADGRSLIMGSTTGQVWTSEDGGDHWSALAQVCHLTLRPPMESTYFPQLTCPSLPQK